MRRNIPFIYLINFLSLLLLAGACTESATEATTHSPASDKQATQISVAANSTEEKVDKFLTAYVHDLKEALAEKDDKITIAKIQQMKEKFAPLVEELKPELEAWEKSLSEEEKEAFESRAENKPYVKDLITTSFNAMGRISKSPELRKAFDDLSQDMDFMSEEISSEDITGEEIPEEVLAEEEGEQE